MDMDLDKLFKPRSITIVGASDDTTKIRGKILQAARQCGYIGGIYPVTRSNRFIDGLECFASVSELPQPPDLAIIVVPAEVVAKVLEECGERGIPAALIISSGFAEQRDEEGLSRQRAIVEIATRYSMTVCGPNAEGFLDFSSPLAATFSPTVLHGPEGRVVDTGHGEPVSIASQSGGIGFSFYNRGEKLGLSFSYVISTGNEASLELLEIVDYLIEDRNTRVVLAFLEGTRSPGKLVHVASKAAAAGKPIIAAKMGRSREAVEAAVSHTGSLTGSHQVHAAVFRHYGITLVEHSDQMLAAAAAFAHFSELLPAGKRVGILSASGGGAIWMTDTCAAAGLEIPRLDEPTRHALEALMPAYGTARNPVDITAQGVYGFGYAKPLEILCSSPAIDIVVCVLSLVNPEVMERDKKALKSLRDRMDKPVLFCSYTLPHPGAVAALGEAGFPCLSSMPDTAAAVLALAEYGEFLAQDEDRAATRPRPVQEVSRQLAAGPTVVHEHAAKNILAAYGLTPDEPMLTGNAEAAVEAAGAFDSPVALKVQSPDIAHKHRAGGVRLGLETPAQVREAYESIIEACLTYSPGAQILGVLIEPMADPGVEMIVGISTDPDFGPMLLVGGGGLMVETFNDTQLAPCPINPGAATRALRRLRSFQRLESESCDIDALVDLLVRVSVLAHSHRDEIKEIDLNPVIVHRVGRGLTIADALIVKHA